MGAVDTASYIWVDQIKKVFPYARMCVLKRDTKAISESLENIGLPFDLEAHERVFLEATKGMREIRYECMFDKSYLSDLWADLIGKPFDTERCEQLLEMHIERDVGKFMANRSLSLHK